MQNGASGECRQDDWLLLYQHGDVLVFRDPVCLFKTLAPGDDVGVSVRFDW
jgi:hypothetical protein